MARATGTFDVSMEPGGAAEESGGVSIRRMALRKQFTGDLAATGEGEMLTAVTAVKGSAAYVAIERVSGTLHGRAGSFVLQHTGRMQAGAQELVISIVPDSGSGELVGITGSLGIRIEDGTHHYTFDYTLPH